MGLITLLNPHFYRYIKGYFLLISNKKSCCTFVTDNNDIIPQTLSENRFHQFIFNKNLMDMIYLISIVSISRKEDHIGEKYII